MIPDRILNRMGVAERTIDKYIDALKDGTVTTPQLFIWETESWDGYADWYRNRILVRAGSCGLRFEGAKNGFILHPAPNVSCKYPITTTQ